MPPLAPPTFLERVVHHLRADDEFRLVVDAFTVSFTIVSIVSSFFDSYSFGLIAAAITHFLAYFWFAKRRLYINKAVLMPAVFLGCAVAVNLTHSYVHQGELYEHLTRYFTFLFMFHFSEFIFTALTNRRSLRPDSFLLNHSVGYWAAASVSWIEFLVEAHFFPELKNNYRILWIGTIGCIIGEMFRKLAMIHAGLGFTHRLAMTKRLDHRLIKDGVYGYMRHPGYFGWFVWAVSTQIILCNPLCCVVYAYVTWHFFSSRIYDEERDLINFFGEQYVEYQQKVWVGVPFVTGYQRP